MTSPTSPAPVPKPVDSIEELEDRLALWCAFREPLRLVNYSSVRELLTASLHYIREIRQTKVCTKPLPDPGDEREPVNTCECAECRPAPAPTGLECPFAVPVRRTGWTEYPWIQQFGQDILLDADGAYVGTVSRSCADAIVLAINNQRGKP